MVVVVTRNQVKVAYEDLKTFAAHFQPRAKPSCNMINIGWKLLK